MLAYVSLIFGALSGAAARPFSPAGQLRPRQPLRSGIDVVGALTHQLLVDPDWPLPHCQSEIDDMVARLRAQLPALALEVGKPHPPNIVAGPAPTDHMGSRIHLILLAESAQHLLSAAQSEVPVPTDRTKNGADATARQNTPVNALGWRPLSGSASTSGKARRHLVATAAGTAERGAAP
ncbi:hypothetical protein [Actinacidiphila sp. ITFR-21]|uniref:hypothetical protein n=1 Tax=Actinacidiphila sp. ITFR-21 TaxID=3075199 RepID=UPI00288A638C|nr:hypothetical protein [Streptomyces sp. ITFR-21]WNI20081.1 hypothetical protein RLT57_31575 [Streptomyces sp. ITFR-21]